MVHIYDFGEGDEISVQGCAFARRGEDGKWELATTSDMKLLLRSDGEKSVAAHAFPLSQLKAGQRRAKLGG